MQRAKQQMTQRSHNKEVRDSLWLTPRRKVWRAPVLFLVVVAMIMSRVPSPACLHKWLHVSASICVCTTESITSSSCARLYFSTCLENRANGMWAEVMWANPGPGLQKFQCVILLSLFPHLPAGFPGNDGVMFKQWCKPDPFFYC